MLLNEIIAGGINLTQLKWRQLEQIIEDSDGDRPSNADQVRVKFKKASLPVKAGMWQGWGFIYEFSYRSVDDTDVTDEWVVHVNQQGSLEIRAL